MDFGDKGPMVRADHWSESLRCCSCACMEKGIRPMSAAEYRKALERNRQTYALFAHVIGVDARTARRWGDGSRKIPAVVSGVLRLMLTGVIKPRQIAQAVRAEEIDGAKRPLA